MELRYWVVVFEVIVFDCGLVMINKAHMKLNKVYYEAHKDYSYCQ